MKNNLKKLFKARILFLSLALLTYGCQKDDNSESIESSDEIQNILSQKISLNEIPNSSQVSDVLRKLSSNLNSDNFLQRTLEPDSVSIDVDDILYMEYGNTHTLTFKLLSSNPKYYIENIVLHYNIDTDSYDEYLLEYTITKEEFIELSNGGSIDEDSEVIITELDTGTVSTILGRSSCSRSCETIYVQCTAGGNHWPGEACTGDPDQVAYSYQECTVTCNGDQPVTITPDDSSSGGGGGNPSDGDVITNPNANEPCDTGRGTIGISGNDGCITTIDDEARNQLFDRLSTYFETQEQADWIVLEADIVIVNSMNDFLDERNDGIEAKTESIMRIDVESAVWTIDAGTFPNRPSLTYTHTFIPKFGEKMYLLENGLVLYQSSVERVINKPYVDTIASTEVDTDGHNYLYDYDTGKWYEYRLPPPTYADTDLTFLFDAFWDGVKIAGRYATPIEDIIILIDGTDFDGVEQDRVQTAGFMIVGFIPGGKAFKPVAKIVNGITKYRKLVKVTVNGIEKSISLPIKIVNGVVEFGSQAYNNQQLRKILNITNSTTHAHHIIPFARRNRALVQRAAKSDKAFHISEKLNGIPRPQSLHLGGHQHYNDVIDNILFTNQHIIDENEAFDFIEGLANHIRDLINANQNLNSGQIADLITYGL